MGGSLTFRLDGRAIRFVFFPIVLLASGVTVSLIGTPRVSGQGDEGEAGSSSPDLSTLALPQGSAGVPAMGASIQYNTVRVQFRVRAMRFSFPARFDIEILQPRRQLVHSPFNVLWDWVVLLLVIPLVGEQLVDLHHRGAPFEVPNIHMLKDAPESEDGLAFLWGYPCELQEFHCQLSLVQHGLLSHGVRMAA